MISSNSISATTEQISVKQCYIMADYFEAQAAQFRRLAQDKNRRRIDREEAEKLEFIERKKMLIAGQKAFELVKSGINKNAACAEIATQTGIKLIWVEAHFELAKRNQAEQFRADRTAKIIKLSKSGKTARKIAKLTNCSKSLVLLTIRQKKGL